MTLRARLSFEWLEHRDNPSVPGGETPYTEPTPPPVDPATVAPPPPADIITDTGADVVAGAAGTTNPPASDTTPTGTSTLPYYP